MRSRTQVTAYRGMVLHFLTDPGEGGDPHSMQFFDDGLLVVEDGRIPGLDIDDLPVFTLQCMSGPLTGKTYVVTDPGRALISGTCADIGKVKGPILRGLAGRAPYFHNGSAATLLDVVKFYNLRFNIGLTSAQMNDLAAFLQTL